MENLLIPSKSSPPIQIPSRISKPIPIPFEFSTKSSRFFTKKSCPEFNDTHLNYLNNNGRLREAIKAIDAISQRGSKIGPATYINLLQSCIDTNSIQLGRELHARIDLVREINPFVETKLVSMYAKCGFLGDARNVFAGMHERNLFTWSAMIGACSRQQRWREVVDLFLLMMGEGVVPDDFLFPKILQACGNCEDFETAKLIHSLVVKCGMGCFLRVSNSLLAVYVKCGKLSLARRIFENMDERDEVSWNAIIAGHFHNGDNEEARRWFAAMSDEGIEPGLVTWNIMIDGYSRSGNCDFAMELMKKMEEIGIKPDVYTWTSMISGFSHNNKTSQALDLFKQMLIAGIEPNGITVLSAISVCGSIKSLHKGLELHSLAFKMGFVHDVLVGNSLIDLYCKCGKLEAAEQVFDKISEKDVFTWNSMIGGYCQAGYCGKAYELFMKMKESENVVPNVITWNVMISGCIQNGNEDQAMNLFERMEEEGKIKRNTASWNSLIAGFHLLGLKNKALGMFRQMQSHNFNPNSVTILSLLPVCANFISEGKVKEIHGCVLRRNLESELPIMNSLIDTYAKTGNVRYSKTIFDRMSSKDIISWNSMIAGYVLHGCSDSALHLFERMKKLSVRPNRGTFASIIYAYGLVGMVEEGRRLFSSISEDHGIIPSLEHYSAMVDLYGRSGRLEESMEFIEDMPMEPDSSIWNNLLTACRIHGNLRLAVLAGKQLLELEPGNLLIQRLMLQAHSLCGKSEGDLKGRKVIKQKLMKKFLGQCWIAVITTLHSFVSGHHSKADSLYDWIRRIREKVKTLDLCNQLAIEEEEKEGTDEFHSEKFAFAFGLICSTRVPQSIKIVKNLRMCGDCHRTAKYISLAYGCEIYLSDSKCLHHFKNGHCSCRDYW